MPRRYREWPGSFLFDKVAEYSGDWRMGATWFWSVFMARIYVLSRNTVKSTFFVRKNYIKLPLQRENIMIGDVKTPADRYLKHSLTRTLKDDCKMIGR